jgi:adenosylcobinamide-GDP ribazoletransferase
MRRFLAALRFLTILPIPGTWGTAEEDLAGSVPFFPVIGLLLGAAAAVVAWGLSLLAPPLLSAATVVVLLIGFSGALHLDGLADTADGFLSSRPRDRILDIMKDSRTGTMGVMAIVCVLLLKFASLASLPETMSWRSAFLMPLAGRCAMVVEMSLLPTVRPGGLGSLFSHRKHCWSALWALGLLAGVAWYLLDWRGLITWAACLLVSLVFSALVYRKIGGATGDTFGAVCEIVEIVPALTLVLV